MAQVTQDVNEGMPLEEERAKDEETGAIEETEAKAPEAETRTPSKKKLIVVTAVVLATIALIIGLSVGLTQSNKNDDSKTNTSLSIKPAEPKNNEETIMSAQNPNIDIFDNAAVVMNETKLELKELSSGEIMSYREFNKGQPHNLVYLPGFMTDDSVASILAVLPQFQDHHIIAVNPIGWNGSTMKKSVYAHEENADQVMELLEAIGIDQAIAMGYSTGGGIAFYLAQKYPDVITTAFLVHSIPLDGLRSVDENGKLVELDMGGLQRMVSIYPEERDALFQFFKTYSSHPETFIPEDHELVDYFYTAAVNMPGKVEAWKANFDFNVSPIKTQYSEPSMDLASLESNIVVIHGLNDIAVPADQVEHITKLAISDNWAPQGIISYYNDHEGHLVFVDNPVAFAKIYRTAFEEQVLIPNGINPNIKIFDDAAALLETTVREEKILPSGETMSYREYNKGQPHKLVFLPGFGGDDTMTSVLAVLPQFQDHHIISVNPIGWYGSTMNTPLYSHEENADEVMELLKLIGVDQAMAMGYSTGGGIAFYLAQKYPKVITTAFLAHSIPLNGLRYVDLTGEVLDVESFDDVESMLDSFYPNDQDSLYDFIKTYFSSNPDGFPPKDHAINLYGAESSINMPGKAEATIANSVFNVCPIQGQYSEASNALALLKSKVIVIHGSEDMVVSPTQVESVTKLAIAEQWAPSGMVSYYDDGEGHMVIIDKPTAFADVYRKAFEEKVLHEQEQTGF
mmetsp:Transcript_15599/g.32816  ORF Transcript_15599/g.32816 Transcript_15599/m.32816 type:complete len:740 (+) Transcript_15599:68-2287(+)